MFDKLIAFSLRYRLLIIAFFLGIFIVGFYELRKMRIDVFPDLNKPTVSVLVESGGLAPAEVEQLVLIPLENSISGSYGLSRLSSNAAVGYGVLKAEFDWDVDLMQARQTVFERMSSVELPEGIFPQLAPVSSIMGEVMLVGLSGEEEVSPMELRGVAEQVVRKRLLGVPGVASVNVIGGDEKQYHIVLDTLKMQTLGISFSDVKEALENKGSNGAGGFLKTTYTEKLVRVEGRPETVSDLEKVVIRQGQGAFPILLKDVAEVKIAPERLKRGEAGINGEKGVLLSVAKQPFADTLRLTRALDE
ncbi:MAG: efflux RND transporter permease subunit, partial [Alphaproteobacteria bacterium]|nr:efflux RND transporter permease subunit [Alphaproteobacteria bacterium]